MTLQDAAGFGTILVGVIGTGAAAMMAQTMDPLSGGAGIAGWSSFGLAGLVLAWLLLVHLPNKDKQAEAKDAKIVEIVTQTQKTIAEQAEATRKERKEERVDFVKALQRNEEQGNTNWARIEAAWEKATDRICDHLDNHRVREREQVAELEDRVRSKRSHNENSGS